MAADKPYGEVYDLHSVSPENFGCTLVLGYIRNIACHFATK
jgi:hypothetical protein